MSDARYDLTVMSTRTLAEICSIKLGIGPLGLAGMKLLSVSGHDVLLVSETGMYSCLYALRLPGVCVGSCGCTEASGGAIRWPRGDERHQLGK